MGGREGIDKKIQKHQNQTNSKIVTIVGSVYLRIQNKSLLVNNTVNCIS